MPLIRFHRRVELKIRSQSILSLASALVPMLNIINDVVRLRYYGTKYRKRQDVINSLISLRYLLTGTAFNDNRF